MTNYFSSYITAASILCQAAIPLAAQTGVDKTFTYDSATGSTWDLGTLTLEGSTTTHEGYIVDIEGTESVQSITGNITASVGYPDDAQKYDSWEVVRISNLPTSTTSYDWTLNLNVSITSLTDELSDAAYGIILHNYAAGDTEYNKIKEVAGSVEISDYRTVPYPSATEDTQPSSYGVEIGAYYDVETLSTTVTASDSTEAVGYQFNAGTRVGVDSNGDAIAGAGVTGSITITDVVQASGILFIGTGDDNPTAAEPLIGYISSDISIKSTTTAVEAAVGIFVNGSGTDNEVKGALTGIFSGSIDIDVLYNETTSTTVNPVVAGIQIIQQEGSEDIASNITFGDGASISSYYTLSGASEKTLGDAVNIESSSDDGFEISTEEDGDKVTLEGNIRSYYNSDNVRQINSLSLLQGDFTLTADTIESTSLNLGSYSEGTMRDASLTLTQSTDISTMDSFAFYVQGQEQGAYSHIKIDSFASLDVTNIKTVDVYLDDLLLSKSAFSVTIIEGLTKNLSAGTLLNIRSSTGTLLWQLDMNEGFAYYAPSESGTANLYVNYQNNGLTIGRLIPEPSSATLSIIALTLLMKRRNRRNSR